MITPEEKHELREHLAVISTSAYFLLQSDDENARAHRYSILQGQIDAIIVLIEKQDVCRQAACSEGLFQ